MTDVITLLEKVGALIRNSHFVGTSGLHFDTYVNKDALYPHTAETSAVCRLFAEKYKDQNIEVVVGPAVGGIILSQWTAHHLSELMGNEVLSIYTEKTPDEDQILKRGYDQRVKGKRILVVEDNVTTGGSMMKTVRAVQAGGGEIVGACVMVNRSPEEVNSEALGIPFDSLCVYPVAHYSAEECPLCKSGVPINTTVGHGKKFLEAQAKNK